MDGVLCDFNRGLTERGLIRPEEFVTERYRQLDLPPARLQRIGDCVRSQGFFLDLEPIPGSLRALEELRSDGFDVWIVSKPPGFPGAWAEKFAWIQRHCPAFQERVVVCTSKHVIQGDVLIDDSLAVLEGWRFGWGLLLQTNPRIRYGELPDHLRLTRTWVEILVASKELYPQV
ncbi:MAG: hypothetical protein ABIK09_17840 [Pseudomonadota bacterium]